MRILETKEIVDEIEKLIDSADLFLIIVSPYLKINTKLKQKFELNFRKTSIKFLFIYQKDSIDEDEILWMQGYHNVTHIPSDHLNANCVINEKAAVMSSTELSENWGLNNIDLGVYFWSDEEPVYRSLLNSLKRIIWSTKTDFNFYNVVGAFTHFTMGTLYAEIEPYYYFPQAGRGVDSLYIYMCDIAKKQINFSKEDYKVDKSAVLRATKLTELEYTSLFNKLRSLGRKIPKKKREDIIKW